MKLKCCSFGEMCRDILANKSRIIMFGAGVLGQITTPEILKLYGVESFVDCYIDNDEGKWNDSVEMFGRHIKIQSPSYLKGCNSNTIILINISRYAEVLKQLEGMECTKGMSGYIMAVMCIHNFCSKLSGGEPVLSKEPLIPKKIHYMWLGKKQLPRNLQKCIDSWKRFCPDYEIIQWNEDNYDVGRNQYMYDAYQSGAYGFVPDYARLDILYRHGGIYMDTDVEVIRNIDALLYQEAFCGVEKWQVINFGGCSGAVKAHSMIEQFLQEREKIRFLDDSGNQNKNTCGFYDTKIALKDGYRVNGKTQNINGMNIYAYDYFHPYDYASGHTNITSNTYSIHRFSGGWLDEKMKQVNKRTAEEYDRVYRMCLSSNFKTKDGGLADVITSGNR